VEPGGGGVEVKIAPNHHISVLVATVMIAAANDDDDSSMSIDDKSRTQLDSHANSGGWATCSNHQQHRKNSRGQSIYS
jgi:hypothetical protein